jgi:hypothetical protein
MGQHAARGCSSRKLYQSAHHCIGLIQIFAEKNHLRLTLGLEAERRGCRVFLKSVSRGKTLKMNREAR